MIIFLWDRTKAAPLQLLLDVFRRVLRPPSQPFSRWQMCPADNIRSEVECARFSWHRFYQTAIVSELPLR
jgi:hypothetical protein